MIIEELRSIARAADMPFGYGNSTRMREFFADGGGIFCLYVPFGGIPGQETWQVFVRGAGAAAAVKMIEDGMGRGGSLNITRTADGYRVDISRSIRVPFSSGGPRIEPVVTADYLYFEAVDAGAVVSAMFWGDEADSFDMNYSTDGGSTWNAWGKTYDSGEEMYLYDNIVLGAVGDKVWFKGVNNAVTDNNTYGFNFFINNGNVAAGGNATSILDGDGETMTEMTAYGLYNLFVECTALTTAPQLPATTLAGHCYEGMFSGCTALTTAPQLPATTLADYCYSGMFYECTALISITCLATNPNEVDCTGWVSGVAASGTFTKAASVSDWETGTSGIPSGWTVQDYNG